jgi:hypothetical protein
VKEMVKVICPKCGNKGSLVAFWVYNPNEKVYKPYFRVTHYSKERYENPSIKYHTKSCYIPKSMLNAIKPQVEILEKRFKRGVKKHAAKKTLERGRRK